MPRWKIYSHPHDDILKEIVLTADKLMQIRNFIGQPITIVSGWRSPEYNTLIGGSRFSYHCKGMAADFYVEGWDCDDLRDSLEPHLADWKIRMENLPGSTWVHIDRGSVVNKRYFKP